MAKAKARPRNGKVPEPALTRSPLAISELPAEYQTSLPRVLKTIVAGRRGTSRLAAIYGDQLLCVRYRYDIARRRRLTTVELVVAQAEWIPPHQMNPGLLVGVRIGYGEAHLRERIKAAGGRWDPKARLWRTTFRKAGELGMEGRIVLSEGDR
jgi:hypothetical protein